MEFGSLEKYRKNPSEAALLALAQEAQALGYTIAYQVTRNSHDADDVTQEMLLEFLDRLPRLRDPVHAKRWIHRVALHKSIDVKRMKKRRSEREKKVAWSLSDRASDRTESVEEVALVHEALATLTEKLRYVIIEHFFAKRTLASLATELGCSAPVVWKRIEQGKEVLARKLKRAGFAATIPMVPAILERTELSACPHALSPAVTAKVQFVLSQSIAATGASFTISVGGIFMSAKQSMTLSHLIIGLFCLMLGAGSMYLASSEPIDSPGEAAAGSTLRPEGPGLESLTIAAAESGDATVSELRARIEELEAELSSRPVAAQNGEEPGEGPSVLVARLERIREWAPQAMRRFQEATPEEQQALEEPLQRELGELTAGLRELIMVEPDLFFDFLKSLTPEQEFMQHLLLDVTQNKHLPRHGSLVVSAGSYPPKFIDGAIELLRNGSRETRVALLQFFQDLRGLSRERVTELESFIWSDDPALAAVGLRAAAGRGEFKPTQEVQEELHRIVREGADAVLLEPAIYYLGQLQGERVEQDLLDRLERGRAHGLESVLLSVLAPHARNTQQPAAYARAITSALRRGVDQGALDLMVQLSLVLDFEHARPILVDLEGRVQRKRRDALVAINTMIDEGQTDVGQFQQAYFAAMTTVEERGAVHVHEETP